MGFPDQCPLIGGRTDFLRWAIAQNHRLRQQSKVHPAIAYIAYADKKKGLFRVILTDLNFFSNALRAS